MKPTLTGVVVVAIFLALGVLGAVKSGEIPGKRYVRDKEMRFVLAEVTPPIGADVDPNAKPESLVDKKWLEPNDRLLAAPNVHVVPGETRAWIQPTSMTPKEARAALAKGGVEAEGVRISWRDTIGVWIAALLTLAIFSFMWGDNPLYKVAESLVVGVSAAYWMSVNFWSTLVPNLFGKLAPNLVRDWAIPGMEKGKPAELLSLVPLALCILLLMRLSPKGGRISNWSLAFVFATTAAVRFVAFVQGDLLAQISSSLQPLIVTGHRSDGTTDFGTALAGTFGNVVALAGVLSVLTYFFFSLDHKGATGKVARLGIWFLMVFLGSAFGFTVMGRIALLAKRLEFLFDDWLWLIDPNKVHTFTSSVAASVATSLGWTG